MKLRSSHRVKGSRAQEAGILMAAVDVPLSFQKTLMPRKDIDQGAITGLSVAADYGIAVLIQEQIESLASFLAGSAEDDERRWRRVSILLDLLAIGGGFAMQKVFAPRPDEKLPRAGARTAGYWIAKSASAGVIVGVLQALMSTRSEDGAKNSLKVVVPAAAALAGLREYDMRRRRSQDDHATADWSVQGRRSGLIGAGLGLGALALSTVEHAVADGFAVGASKILPGSRRFWKPFGHALTLGAFAYGIKEGLVRVYRKIEATAETIEPAYEEKPTSNLVSAGPESLVSWESLSRQGRRNVATALTPERIEEVMGEAAVQPIRVYVGLESAEDDDARVALALAELERTEAFERDLLMVISPTGTGYVNYVAVEAAEYMTRGNMASVTMQYSMRPSPMSVDRVDRGRHLQRMLLDALRDRLATAERKPKLVLFGESLGAWTSQDQFEHQGTQGLVAHGVDRALWIGTPYASKWKSEVLNDERPDTDRSLVGVFNDFGQLEAMAPEDRSKLRFVMITHDNDAVGHFWLDMLIQAPPWLGKDHEARPATVPKHEKWAPPTTFFQTAVDMANAAQVVPGEFEATGHDYRKDLAVFVREVFDLEVSDEQLASIEDALREFELKRAARAQQLNPPKKKRGAKAVETPVPPVAPAAEPATDGTSAKRKPVARRSAAKEAIAKKSTAKKEAAKKSTAKRATSRKPTTTRKKKEEE